MACRTKVLSAPWTPRLRASAAIEVVDRRPAALLGRWFEYQSLCLILAY